MREFAVALGTGSLFFALGRLGSKNDEPIFLALFAFANVVVMAISVLTSRRLTRKVAAAETAQRQMRFHYELGGGRSWTFEADYESAAPDVLMRIASSLLGTEETRRWAAHLADDEVFRSSLDALARDIASGVERPFDSLEDRLRQHAE